MFLVANCEASGRQQRVPAKPETDDADIPTNLWCDLSKYSSFLSAYFDFKPFTLHARGPDGKQVSPWMIFSLILQLFWSTIVKCEVYHVKNYTFYIIWKDKDTNVVSKIEP